MFMVFILNSFSLRLVRSISFSGVDSVIFVYLKFCLFLAIEIVCGAGTSDGWENIPSCWFVAFLSLENSDFSGLCWAAACRLGL